MSNIWKEMERKVNTFLPEDRVLFQHKAYQRHFEGYVEKRVPGRNGKEKVVRVYKGDYYEQDLTGVQHILLRLAYVAGMLIAAGLFVRGATCEMESNFAAPVVLSEAVTGLLMLWSVFSLITYLITPRKMTVGDYNSVGHSLKKALRNNVVGLICVLVLTLAYDVFFKRGISRDDFLCMACFALSGLIFWGMRYLESNIRYRTC